MDWKTVLELNPGFGSICLRLLCAMIVGLVIGTEREYTNRPAGMRTHILVALGACVVAITGELISHQYGNTDPARLGAQVISGVGFLGAGTILREGPTVKGLTTAASLWAVACLGIAAGFGYYPVALAGMVFIFVTLTILEVFQTRFMRNHSTTLEYALETEEITAALNQINIQAQSEQVSIGHLQVQRLPDNHYSVTFQAKFGGGRSKQHHQHFFESLVATPEILSVHQSEVNTHRSKV